jgi:hypothetical protein
MSRAHGEGGPTRANRPDLRLSVRHADEVNSGGEFPKEPGLEARVSRLEAAMAEIRAEFKAIHVELARFARLEAGVDQLRQDMAEIKGRLTNYSDELSGCLHACHGSPLPLSSVPSGFHWRF